MQSIFTSRARLIAWLVATAMLVIGLPPTPSSADSNPATINLSQSCAANSSMTANTLRQSGVQGVSVGERVTFQTEVHFDAGTIYQDVFTRSDGSTYVASYLELLHPDSPMVIDPASLKLTINGAVQPLNAGTEPDPSAWIVAQDVSVPGQIAWRVYFPGDTATMVAETLGHGVPSHIVAAGGEDFVFSVDGHLADVPEATQGAIITGVQCFTSVSTGPSSRNSDRQHVDVAVVEPVVNLTKDRGPIDAISAGQLASFTITAEVPTTQSNGVTAVGPAYELALTDTLPAELTPVDATGIDLVNGASTADGGVWDQAARTLRWVIGTQQPGSTVERTYRARVGLATPPASLLTNTVVASGRSQPAGVTTDNRVYSNLATAQATLRVTSGKPTVTKVATPVRYGPGLPITYVITVQLPANSSYENFVVWDQAANGMGSFSAVSATCAGTGCPAAPTVLPGVSAFSLGLRFGWSYGSIAASATVRTLTITYRLVMRTMKYQDLTGLAAEIPTVPLEQFDNVAHVVWNNVNRTGAASPSLGALPLYDNTISASAMVVWDRPQLEVTKVSDRPRAWNWTPGETANYTATVRNTGTQPASSVVINDIPVGIGIDLASVTIDGNPCGGACALGVGGRLVLNYPGTIAVGQTVMIRYLGAPTQTGSVRNVFQIPTYQDPFGTSYLENPTASVTNQIPDPVLTITKELDPAANPSAGRFGSTSGTGIPFKFTITNTSAATAFSPRVTEALPSSSFCFVGGSASNGVTSPAANVWQLPGNLGPGQTFTFTARIDVCGSVPAAMYTNNVTLTWSDPTDGTSSSGAPYQASSSAQYEIVDPTFTVSKEPGLTAGAVIGQDDTILDSSWRDGEWVIRVTNTSSVPSGGIVISDPMPETFEYTPGAATVIWIGGAPQSFTDTSAAAGLAGVIPGTRTAASITINNLLPGQAARVSIPFRQNGLIPADKQTERINTVSVTNPSWPTGTALTAQGAYTIIPLEPGVRVAKTVAQGLGVTPGTEIAQGAPNDIFTYTIDTTIQGDAFSKTTHDVMVRDLLPNGMQLVNTPSISSVPGGGGWSVSCVSGPCTAEFGGVFLGAAPGASTGTTELSWWFGDYTNVADSVYRITFAARMLNNIALPPGSFDPSEIVDGQNDPIVNRATPYFNRDITRGTGASGDLFVGLPASAPAVTSFDRAYPPDRAVIDVVTPHISFTKRAQVGGQITNQVNVGETFSYQLIATNDGGGPAFNVAFRDNLGVSWLAGSRFIIDPGSISVSPAGASCALVGSPQHLECNMAGPLAGDPDGPAGPLLGGQIVVAYSGTSQHSADLLTPTSPANYDPDVIRNVAEVDSYNDNAVPGTGNVFTSGEALTNTYVMTPQAEVETGYVSNCPATAFTGSESVIRIALGNGDYPPGTGEFDGDIRPNPWATRDLNGDGFVEPSLAVDPTLTLTLPASLHFTPGTDAVTATGPGPLAHPGNWDYSQPYVPFPDPDVITVNPDGTTTLQWTTLADIPSGYAGNGSFRPEYILQLSATVVAKGSTLITARLDVLDAEHNPARGTSSGEPWSYAEEDAAGCGESVPNHQIYKTPDVGDNVHVLPDQKQYFSVRVNNGRANPLTGLSLIDTLPRALQYAGTLAVANPNYEVATITPVPAGWTNLQAYLTATTVQSDGSEQMAWSPPPLPNGSYVIRIPVVGKNPAVAPNQFATNHFQLLSDQGPRSDTGAMFVEAVGAPTFTKIASKTSVGYNDTVTWTLDVRIPASLNTKDLVLRDLINASRGGRSSLADLVPMRYDGTILASCISGCDQTNPMLPNYDGITPTTYQPIPLVDHTGGTPPLPGNGTLYGYTATYNNAMLWHIGDISPDPDGSERVVRIVYRTKTPPIAELWSLYQMRYPTRHIGGSALAWLNDPANVNYLFNLSSADYTNRAELRSSASNMAYYNVLDGTRNDWWNFVGGLA